MKGLAIVAIIICLFSCKRIHPLYNPEAIKLNDSAVMMQQTMAGDQLKAHIGKDSFAKIQLSLLNRATKIDSNYFLGYWTKFGIQYASKQYANALVTGKEMVRLRPKDAIVKYLVGKIYDKTGDTIHARLYYEDYLNYCNRILDTMSKSNKQLKSIELQKALVLILLNRPQQGHEILNKLYQTADSFNKDSYLLYMHLIKADLLAAKDTSITVGQNTTLINTAFP
jgi:tetratricopeptide (TPR) repeat protein